MKIGIITIQKCNNYGSDLQAFALQYKLRLMGHDVENIDYLFYKNPRHVSTRLSRPTFKVSLKNRIKEFLFPKIYWLKQLLNRKIEKDRATRFDDFFKKNVNESREFRTVDALMANPPIYDVYMVGSDELWNKRCNSSMLPFFLSFAPKGAKKVAYAASTGAHDNYDIADREIYKRHLPDFSAISMREASSCKCFGEMLGREIIHVVDPTLLLTAQEWDNVAIPYAQEKPYILVYDLIPSDAIWSLARRWAKARRCEIVRICGDSSLKPVDGVKQFPTFGPAEYIGLFKNAKGVITNSFHGTVFSIIYGKPFYCVIPSHMTDAGRMGSLLKVLEIDSRIVRDVDVDDLDINREMDNDAALNKLAALRDHSVDFIRNALS